MNEKIIEIKQMLNARRTIEAKNLLDELNVELEKLDNFQEFFDEIKKLCRDSGRTAVVSISQIEELITKYGEKK